MDDDYQECSTECLNCLDNGCWETDGIEWTYLNSKSVLVVPCINCLKSCGFVWQGEACYGGIFDEDNIFHRNLAENYAFNTAWLFIDRFEDPNGPLFGTKTIDQWVSDLPENLKVLVIDSYEEQIGEYDDIWSDYGTEIDYRAWGG